MQHNVLPTTSKLYKKKQNVNTDAMEINKPSALTQAIFYNDESMTSLACLTGLQLDMFNSIFYKGREIHVTSEKVLDGINQLEEVQEIKEFMSIVFDVAEFTEMFGKYTHGNYDALERQLRDFSNMRVVVNALNKHANFKTTFTRLIHKIEISRNKGDKRKKLRIVLDGDMSKMLLDVKRFFTKFFLKIQFSLVSKFSKILYELTKDYQNLGAKTISVDMLMKILNVAEKDGKFPQWGLFNQNILKKAIEEINKKTDIFLVATPIKEKNLNERLRVTKVRFSIRKQPDSRLRELGLLLPENPAVDEKLSGLELTLIEIAFDKSRARLANLMSKQKYKVFDKNKWVATDVERNGDEYICQEKIDIWSKGCTKKGRSMVLAELAQANKLKLGNDPTVIIDETYRLIGIFSKKPITHNAVDTFELISNMSDILTNMIEEGLIEAPNAVDVEI